MQILECWLKHYGKFSDYRITFHAGLNIIEGGNESGKSTVFSFIRAMLYGIQKNRSKNLDEYQLRQPWDGPDYFAGSMKVHMNDRIYRIDRNFLKKDESLSVVCETEGREIEDPQSFLCQLVGGLSEEDFVNTFYIRQTQVSTDARLGEDIRDFLVNVQESGNARTNVAGAALLLKKKRREIEAERKKTLDEASGKLEENRREAGYVRNEIARLQQRLEESGKEEEAAFVRKQAEAASAGGTEDNQAETSPAGGTEDIQAAAEGTEDRMPSKGEAEAQSQDADREQIPPVLLPLLFASAVMAVLCSIFAQSDPLKYTLLALGAVFAAGGIWTLFRKKMSGGSRDKDQRKLRKAERSVKRYDSLNKMFGYRDNSVDPELEERKRRLAVQREKTMQTEEASSRSETAAEVARIMKERAAQREMASSGNGLTADAAGAMEEKAVSSGRMDALAAELREKQRHLAELDQEFSRLSEQKDGLKDRDLELQAVDMARERIERLSGTIYHETGEEFSRRVSELLSSLTQGNYTSISMDEKMEVNINTPDRLLKLSQVSYGTACQIYFALRIAAGELLSGNAALPLLLDEPFAMYDDERLKEALRFLAGYGRQILLFTCQGREKVFAREI